MSLSTLYIDYQVADFPEVLSIQSRLNIPAEIVYDIKQVYNTLSSATDPVEKGKNVLYLTRNKGAFIKTCPGTSAYTCCGYKILHIGTFCTMDCSYCILQTYFHPPLLQFFVNHDDLDIELDNLFAQKNISRIGTGEFTDSMIWEKWTDLSGHLVKRFSKQNKAVLELKTKTTNIRKLESLSHNRKTITSWSVNTDAVICSEERNTTSLSSRLKAAAQCEAWGYPVAFHFDPMVIYDGCEEEYMNVVKQIFAHVSPDNIVWISIGSFRFIPSLKQLIQKRFPDSRIVYGEFISGLDGKMRYFKPLRINLYKKIVACIKKYAPEIMIYFCMEDDEVWEKCMGFVPSDRGGLPCMLDSSAVKICGVR